MAKVGFKASSLNSIIGVGAVENMTGIIGLMASRRVLRMANGMVVR